MITGVKVSDGQCCPRAYNHFVWQQFSAVKSSSLNPRRWTVHGLKQPRFYSENNNPSNWLPSTVMDIYLHFSYSLIFFRVRCSIICSIINMKTFTVKYLKSVPMSLSDHVGTQKTANIHQIILRPKWLLPFTSSWIRSIVTAKTHMSSSRLGQGDIDTSLFCIFYWTFHWSLSRQSVSMHYIRPHAFIACGGCFLSVYYHNAVCAYVLIQAQLARRVTEEIQGLEREDSEACLDHLVRLFTFKCTQNHMPKSFPLSSC